MLRSTRPTCVARVLTVRYLQPWSSLCGTSHLFFPVSWLLMVLRAAGVGSTKRGIGNGNCTAGKTCKKNRAIVRMRSSLEFCLFFLLLYRVIAITPANPFSHLFQCSCFGESDEGINTLRIAIRLGSGLGKSHYVIGVGIVQC